MAFAERFRRRRGLDAITGFAGGSLEDQLDQQNPPPRQPIQFLQTPQPSMADRYMATAQPEQPASPVTRSRSTNPFLERFTHATPPVALEKVGEGKFRVPDNVYDPGRPQRVTEPPDEVTKSSDYLQQVRGKPLGLRDKLGLVAQNIATNLGGTPLATRRQRDLARAGEGLQQDLAVQGQQFKSQALQSQMDAREAAQRAVEERLTQGQAKLEQTAVNQRRQRLISQHSELKEFDPNDAKNAGFVAAWTREFGYPPPRKTSGSLLQYNTGYDANGNLVTEITDKGTGQVTQTQGSNIVQSEQGATRKQQGEQFGKAESGRNERARLGRAAAMDRAIVMAGARGAAMGDPEEYGKWATESDEDAKTALAKAEEAGPRHAGPYLAQANAAKARAVRLRELETKARGAQSSGGIAPKGVAPRGRGKGQRVSPSDLNKVLGLP